MNMIHWHADAAILLPWPESLAHVNWLRAAARLGLR
jgi:hypothetical protein